MAGVRSRRFLLVALALLAGAAVTAARRARLEPMLVEGSSMLPTLRPGQRIAVAPLRRPPARGALVVLRRPADGLEVVKRVAGLPGERARLHGGLEVTLGPDEYFVLGDNPAASTDGRAFGPVPAGALVGRVRFAYWPPRMRLRG
jgi:signal peptidase I